MAGMSIMAGKPEDAARDPVQALRDEVASVKRSREAAGDAGRDGLAVVESDDLPLQWVPRPYQAALWEALHEHGMRRVDVVAHRRWGKDEVALHWTAGQAALRPGNYWHMLPTAEQGRKAIWLANNPHTGERRIDEAFPLGLRRRTLDGEMLIELINGSTWQVLGAENADAARGTSVLGVVLSEWAEWSPRTWTTLSPILEENGGWAMFLWTPKGRNHATVAFENRKRQPETWFCLKSPASETGVFDAAGLAAARRGITDVLGEAEGGAQYAAEYLLEFDAATPGAYYAGVLAEAEREGRIGRVPVDPSLPVDTAWDLGIDDYTAVWFFQQAGREVRVVDYYETGGVGLDTIVREAIGGRDWLWGAHHLPHDVMVRELATGRSRYETLGGLGLRPILAGTATDPEERINAARLLIPLCWFDAERCGQGLERLRAYRKRWNRPTATYAGPLHDAASHGADAFGEYALNRRALRAAGREPAAAPTRGSRRHTPGGLSWMG